MTPRKETPPSQASTRAEFTALTEDEVRKALREDTDCECAIAAEVNRLVAVYASLYLECVKRTGPVTPLVLLVRAEWPIERVAVEIVVKDFTDKPAEASASIH